MPLPAYFNRLAEGAASPKPVEANVDLDALDVKALLAQSLVNNDGLNALLDSLNQELHTLQGPIEALEKQIEALGQLKAQQNKLLALKESLKALQQGVISGEGAAVLVSAAVLKQPPSSPVTLKPGALPAESFNESLTFFPERALLEVKQTLKRPDSLNMELFRALVFSGGKATTDQIRQFLVENNVRQPSTGLGFEEASRSDISTRMQYLLKQGLVQAVGTGVFRATLGWE